MEPFIGMITIFAGNFAPRGWAFCNGQLLAISQNTALFSLLGTIYGGDGRTTFGLPDLRGRVPIHAGNGPGLEDIRLGAKSGLNRTFINLQNLPSHNHQVRIPSKEEANTETAKGNFIASAGFDGFGTTQDIGDEMAPFNTANSGEDQPRPLNNMQPYLGLNFIIATQGIYPSRS